MSPCQLIIPESGDIIVPRLKIAATFWSRFRGLQLQSPLQPDEGLLIAPGGSVHTHWMRFAIDVVMLSEDGTVLDVRREVRPWKVCTAPRGTRFVLETLGGTTPLQVNDTVRLRFSPAETPPSKVVQLTEPAKFI